MELTLSKIKAHSTPAQSVNIKVHGINPFPNQDSPQPLPKVNTLELIKVHDME